MIALISDVHGNLVALEEVMKSIRGMGINEVYCLGDIAGYYPQVNECCAALRTQRVHCILGNHDWYIASRTFCPRSRSANECLRYQQAVITEENRKWISLLPVCRTLGNLSMVHGGWSSPLDEYFVPSEEGLRALPSNFCCSGHTHRQLIESLEGKTYCNPGSVGQPRDLDPRAAFATFDGSTFSLHRVAYDVDEICGVTKQAGFSEYFYKRLRTGSPHFEQ